jgi:hypothetical protein
MTSDDALKLLIQWLRSGRTASYGYDVYLPPFIEGLATDHLERKAKEQGKQRIATFGGSPYAIEAEARQLAHEISPAFFDAAWELCRRGVLRPGISHLGAQSTIAYSEGAGYSITPFGRAWLQESHLDDFVPTEPQRFGEMLKSLKARCGAVFYERAQEAVRCYGAHAYLACCAMCGAASESILLALASAKRPEDEVLRTYMTANGRARVENIVIGQATAGMQNEFRGYLTLLKYWRDEAAHGTPSNISDNEAYTSLALLYRFGLFAKDRWDELTVTPP